MGIVVIGESLPGLVPGQSLKAPHRPLAKGRVLQKAASRGFRNDCRGCDCPAQITGIKVVKRHSLKPVRQRLRLLKSQFGQGAVEMVLEPATHIPFRLSMTGNDEAGDRHGSESSRTPSYTGHVRVPSSWLLAASVLGLAGCQPPRVEPERPPASAHAIEGTWTINSRGYKDGVYRTPKEIITSYTDYHKDGTYETVQQYVTDSQNSIYTETGVWSYNGSFLQMEPKTKKRRMIEGKSGGQPTVTGEVFQLEVQELTDKKMRRVVGGEVTDFIRSGRPRQFTKDDLAAEPNVSA